jgi:hypothetical protein
MGSSAQALPYFGRAWDIVVDTSTRDRLVLSSSQMTAPLRATFSAEMRVDRHPAYWTAHVTIYNLSTDTAQKIWQSNPMVGPNLGSSVQVNPLQQNNNLVLGDRVTISAGYQTDATGKFDPGTKVIYQGRVLQPVWLREGVVDYKLTLRMATGLIEDAFNFSSFSLAKNATAATTLSQICAHANPKIAFAPDSSVQAKLSSVVNPRGQAFHDRPFQNIQQIVADNGLFSWVGPNGLNVRKFPPDDQTPDYAYGPPNLSGNYAPNGTKSGQVKPTLIGVPEQTQQGVLFRVLLDPTVKLGDVVQLAPGTNINQYPLQIPGRPAFYSKNETYVVTSIQHVGDTRGRGDDWYTEINGAVMDFFSAFNHTHRLPRAPNT